MAQRRIDQNNLTRAATDVDEVLLVGPNGAPLGSPDSPLPFSPVAASACSITSIGDETSDTVLLAANPDRLSVRIVNDSTATLYVACTEAASAINYTARLEQYDAVTIPGFTGAINGIWSANGGGNARISEFS